MFRTFVQITVFLAPQISLLRGSAPLQQGQLHLLKAHFREVPPLEFRGFPCAQLVAFSYDLRAPMEVMLKLVICLNMKSLVILLSS